MNSIALKHNRLIARYENTFKSPVPLQVYQFKSLTQVMTLVESALSSNEPVKGWDKWLNGDVLRSEKPLEKKRNHPQPK